MKKKFKLKKKNLGTGMGLDHVGYFDFYKQYTFLAPKLKKIVTLKDDERNKADAALKIVIENMKILNQLFNKGENTNG